VLHSSRRGSMPSTPHMARSGKRQRVRDHLDHDVGGSGKVPVRSTEVMWLRSTSGPGRRNCSERTTLLRIKLDCTCLIVVDSTFIPGTSCEFCSHEIADAESLQRLSSNQQCWPK